MSELTNSHLNKRTPSMKTKTPMIWTCRKNDGEPNSTRCTRLTCKIRRKKK